MAPSISRRSRWSATTAGLAVLGIGLAGAVPATAHAGYREARAVIRYTEYGIPHILANDFRGLGEGYGFASARDNLCLLADAYVTVGARRSFYHGPDAPPETSYGRASSNVNSDLYFQSISDSGVVERLMQLPPPRGPEPAVKDLVHGYVAGYNRYLATVGAANVTDPACRGAAWLRPITERDVYHHVYAVTTMTGAGSAIDGIVTAQPPTVPAAGMPGTAGTPRTARTAGTAAIAHTPTAESMVAAIKAHQESPDLGSNALAVGAEGTRSGQSILLGNPHYPWYGPRRFWQSHLTIPGKLNVSGASLLGMPGVMIGHNSDVAWSHTVSTPTTFGLFEAQLVPGEPTTYLVDGEPERMTSRNVRVEVRDADGSLRTVSRTLWSTRYGPVLNAGPGLPLPWVSTRAYSLRDANATNLRALNSWLGLARARSADGVIDALSRTQGLPWVNTLATDRAGHAVYADIQVVPHLTDELARTCSTALGAQIYQYTGVSILDGGRAACAWGSDPGAVEPGLLPPAALPTLIRSDYVANGNDSPWLVNPEAPITGYPRILGVGVSPIAARTQELILTAQRRLAGTDGRPGKGFSAADMSDALFSGHSRIAELAAADTAAMCYAFPDGQAPSTRGPVTIAAACAALKAWDHRFQVDSRGALLFLRFVQRLGARAVPGGAWRVPFDAKDPVGTPRDLAVEKPAVQQAFGDAAADLTAAGIPLDGPLGVSQYVTRNGQRIPVHGAPHSLGVLNVISPVWDPQRGNTDVNYGSSFIQVVGFRGERPPSASTLMTYSQSSDPTSPHFADQTLAFSAGQWVTERFTERDILASPQLRIETLPGCPPPTDDAHEGATCHW